MEKKEKRELRIKKATPPLLREVAETPNRDQPWGTDKPEEEKAEFHVVFVSQRFFLAIVTASLRTNRPEDLGRHKGLKGKNPSTPFFELEKMMFFDL